ncbi:MAG: HNH endonuclease [Burkholderiaceae bacterium]|nr:HNH endonuclease [Burkholderiaceae bacterium]
MINAVHPAVVVCPLCGRAVPPAQRDAHHLVPKSKGGRQTTLMHRVCHRQIHALLTETQLARQYATVEALLAHPELKVFVSWVQTKPDDFFVATRKSAAVRKRR